jgi:hypothetical protein
MALLALPSKVALPDDGEQLPGAAALINILTCSSKPYNPNMARGWESKSVEEQIELAVTDVNRGERTRLTPAQAANQRRLKVLDAARASILQRLQTTENERYRQLLQDELADVEAQIKTFY